MKEYETLSFEEMCFNHLFGGQPTKQTTESFISPIPKTGYMPNDTPEIHKKLEFGLNNLVSPNNITPYQSPQVYGNEWSPMPKKNQTVVYEDTTPSKDFGFGSNSSFTQSTSTSYVSGRRSSTRKAKPNSVAVASLNFDSQQQYTAPLSSSSSFGNEIHSFSQGNSSGSYPSSSNQFTSSTTFGQTNNENTYTRSSSLFQPSSTSGGFQPSSLSSSTGFQPISGLTGTSSSGGFQPSSGAFTPSIPSSTFQSSSFGTSTTFGQENKFGMPSSSVTPSLGSQNFSSFQGSSLKNEPLKTNGLTDVTKSTSFGSQSNSFAYNDQGSNSFPPSTQVGSSVQRAPVNNSFQPSIQSSTTAPLSNSFQSLTTGVAPLSGSFQSSTSGITPLPSTNQPFQNQSSVAPSSSSSFQPLTSSFQTTTTSVQPSTFNVQSTSNNAQFGTQTTKTEVKPFTNEINSSFGVNSQKPMTENPSQTNTGGFVIQTTLSTTQKETNAISFVNNSENVQQNNQSSVHSIISNPYGKFILDEEEINSLSKERQRIVDRVPFYRPMQSLINVERIGKKKKNPKEKIEIDLPIEMFIPKNEPIHVETIAKKERKKFPILTKEGYSFKPSLRSMRKMDLTKIKDFTVYREGFGCIKFLGETNVENLNLDEIISIDKKSVTVYADETKKPKYGEALNKPAIITLLNVFPKKTQTQLLSASSCVMDEVYVDKLRKLNSKSKSTFLHYCKNTGEWMFKVENF
jgi:hypothetical protein